MKTERVLLSPTEWWIGKKDGKLLAMMFGRRCSDGLINVEWELLDESNLPVDLVRCDGEEYSFILPVGLQGRPVDKVCSGGGFDLPNSTTDTQPPFSGELSDIDGVSASGGVSNGDATDGGPIKGISTHGVAVGGSENSSTNAKRMHPIPGVEDSNTDQKSNHK